MPKFVYKAKEGPERIVEGIMEAETREQVVDRLQGMGYFPISVAEESVLKGEGSFLFPEGRIKRSELAVFTRQLSDLLDSGITLLRALNLIEEQTENLVLRGIISTLAREIKEGKRFSDSLLKFPQNFSRLYVALVKAGEVGGMLDEVLLGLADYLEKEEELRARVRSALAYPLLMAGVGVATIFILMSFVIPRLAGIFKDMGQNLPVPTLLLIKLGDFLQNFWWLVLAFFSFIFFVFRRRAQTAEGSLFFDRIKLNFPLFGGLIKKSEIARFCRTLSTLLRNGVPMLGALDTVIPVINNSVIRKEIERMHNEVRDGLSLSQTITKSPYFPPLVSNMIAVGEEGGVLENSLMKVAESFEREVERIVKVITSLIEPALILVMGSVVGFIVISMLLPIFQLNLVSW
ncbi:MAG: type II secretion system F family protein [Candidatus Omnitrophica bacterium]|nr:type II secretion system F family protein [Candidatus Omnitrophota bacterium]MCM8793843.1 type II secretion system F family protein [Candidatus Omnitrophota bacterium]